MEMSCFQVRSAVVRGVEAVPVTVEAYIEPGLPGFTVVGMPDSYVLEARSRIRCAIRACGFAVPAGKHITLSVVPAALGRSVELAMAAAILAVSGQVPAEGLSDAVLFGGVTPEGAVEGCPGAVCAASLAREAGLKLVCAPDCAAEAAAAGLGGSVRQMALLGQLSQGLGSLAAPARRRESPAGPALDFSDVVGQEAAKRAFVVAAAGGHSLLMIGPPGSGKAMMARRMTTIMGPLEGEGLREAMAISSAAGNVSLGVPALAAGERPFRAPHWSSSRAGLLGGGRPVSPGEVSLAHGGVLFLEELAEFDVATLVALRSVRGQRGSRIVRADGEYRIPADFLLVGSARPCPCGHLGDRAAPCTDAPDEVWRYQGGLAARSERLFDMTVAVARTPTEAVLRGRAGTASARMAEQVASGREFAAWRRGRQGEGSDSIRGMRLDEGAVEVLSRLLNSGAAATAGVARTVADLAHRETVCMEDAAEALAYRDLSETLEPPAAAEVLASAASRAPEGGRPGIVWKGMSI